MRVRENKDKPGKVQLVFVKFYLYIMAETYTAAVMEFAINIDSSNAVDALEKNTQSYLKLIEDIKLKSPNVDLVIFPESSLMYYYYSNFNETAAILPESSGIILCNSTYESYMSFLKNFSCAAIRHQTIIVINFTEKGSDGRFYNTNVAFGTNGTIIAKYRKWNLFGEYAKSKPSTLDLPVIKMKNTTFGIMTCFDIQFGIPAFNLTKDLGVRNIIFPLNWISELPYLTAVQVQQMWGQELNVVLLASGASLPSSGAGGSGIYFGTQGAIQSNFLASRSTQVLIHEVPSETGFLNFTEPIKTLTEIDQKAKAMDTFYMLVDSSIKDHNSTILDTNNNSTTTMVCHGEEPNILCCNFQVTTKREVNQTDFNSYVYHLVVYNGVRTYSGVYNGGVETCGVIACLNASVKSCGQRFSNYSQVAWPLTFTNITVTGNFRKTENRIQFASTLLSSIMPLSVSEYSWSKSDIGEFIVRRLTLEKPQNRLLTFGIFGRDFQRDKDPFSNIPTGVSKTMNCSFYVLFISVFILFAII
ncbi:hypothetical protein ABEB36_015246 [Hypothenemus hampei]|uniref:CN hydrolase domain-containing protein n=1 Tax=Hypothenemus hampei TaxID=57062 RepID=A0ABD1E2W4_HYPHA